MTETIRQVAKETLGVSTGKNQRCIRIAVVDKKVWKKINEKYKGLRSLWLARKREIE